MCMYMGIQMYENNAVIEGLTRFINLKEKSIH